jgi:Domain of unknown function (DUF1929)/FG-GAP-like repeat
MQAGFARVPNWGSWENQGGGIAVADVNSNGQSDMIVFQIDNPAGANRGLYRVGRNLDALGNMAGGWGAWIEIPDWFAWENQGGSVAVADLDNDGQPELVVFMIDNPPGQNQGYYRVGKNLNATGAVTGGWGPWMPIPDWFSWENQYGGIAVADLNNDGALELIVMMVDNPPGANRGVYRVGTGLDANGNVTGGWSPWIDVPDWFFWENQGAAIAVTSPNGAGQRDLIVFQIDNAIGQNQAFYKIGHNVGLDGNVTEWSPWIGVPAWSSWENQGGGATVARLNGKEHLLAFMVDNPPGENAGLYELLDLEEDPAIYGRWEVLSFHSEVLAVHTALLPGGKVLFYAGSGSSRVRFDSPRFGDEAQGIYVSVVWNPAVPPGPGPGNPNFFHPPTLRAGDGRPFDLFCGGDTFMADGRLLSAGGTLDYGPFKGRPDVAVYDPQAQQWSFVQPMAHGRWYPTLVTLGDSRVLAASGLDETGGQNNTIEKYSAATDTWQVLPMPQPPQFPGLPLYAHLFLMDDGRILFTGGRMDDDRDINACILDISSNPVALNFVEGLTEAGMRNQSASVILPPAQNQQIMILGGGPAGKPNKTDAIDNVDIIDLKSADPRFVPAASMLLPRMHLNAVLLPDHTVLVSGGSLKQEDEPLARLQAEIYDPASNIWKLAARASVPRLYHSTAVLLPDGRVVAAGGNPEGGSQVDWEPPDKEEEMRLEVYSPPYLFRGPRPTITSAPKNCTYGQTISIQSPQAGSIRWVSIIRPGVTTHSFDNSQRLVDLDIVSQAGHTVKVGLTNNPNLAPPGWYMLFLVDTNGVPSVAEWIHLQ